MNIATNCHVVFISYIFGLFYLAQVVFSFPEVEIAIQGYSTKLLKRQNGQGNTVSGQNTQNNKEHPFTNYFCKTE